MLADPRADALGERFAIQWLDLDRLGTDVKPDPSRYPEFDARMKHDMKAEVIALASHIFRGDRPLLEFLTADYSFLNQRLAALYGVEGVSGDALRQVRFESPRRGGVLGMAAVHAVTSYPLRTSPVLRGRWVLEVLLGEKVPPPPPDVPPLDEKGQAAAPMTLRKQLEVHRVKAECAACHDKMDPLGFGMENFDVLGRWRDTDHGQPIDSTGTLPSGKVFQGPEGLKGLLTERRDAVMRHLCRKMTGFAFGRELNKFDDCVIDSAMSALKEREYRASALVEAIANSFAFRNRFYPRQQAE